MPFPGELQTGITTNSILTHVKYYCVSLNKEKTMRPLLPECESCSDSIASCLSGWHIL